jgi:hypothetical protein
MRRLFIFLLSSFIAFAPSVGDIPSEVFFNVKVDLIPFLGLLQKFRDEYSANPVSVTMHNGDQLDAVESMLGPDWVGQITLGSDRAKDDILEDLKNKKRSDRASLLKWGLRHRLEDVRTFAKDAMGLDDAMDSIDLAHSSEFVGDGAQSPTKIISQRSIERQRSALRNTPLTDEDYGSPSPTKGQPASKKSDWRSMSYEEGFDWSEDEDGPKALEGAEDVASSSDEDGQEEGIDFDRDVAEQGWAPDLGDDFLQEEEPEDTGALSGFAKLMLEEKAKKSASSSRLE